MGVKTHILSVLENVRPGRLTASVVLAEIRIMVGRCGESDLSAGLRALEDAKLICSAEDSLTGDRYYAITASGSKRLKGDVG